MVFSQLSTSNQIKRTISGSLLNTSSRQKQQEERAKWLARIGIVAGLLFLLLYLGVYLSALHAALHQSNAQKSSINDKENILSVTDMKRPAEVVKHGSVRTELVTSDSIIETLVLHTSVGDIRIVLRPDLSKESVEYVKELVQTGSCQRCTLYRAEKPGILQGIMKSSSVAGVRTKGSCPAEYEDVKNDCPSHDTSCACHGPVMTHGMVGWAAGQTGPDFFMDIYKKPAKFWGTQHTVWGEIQDDASFVVIDQIWTLPTHNNQGLTHLDQPLKFDMNIE